MSRLQAMAVFEDLSGRGLSPTVDTYRALINAFATAGLIEDSLPFLKAMHARYGIPDDVRMAACIPALYPCVLSI